jgi:hypothetical protein
MQHSHTCAARKVCRTAVRASHVWAAAQAAQILPFCLFGPTSVSLSLLWKCSCSATMGDANECFRHMWRCSAQAVSSRHRLHMSKATSSIGAHRHSTWLPASCKAVRAAIYINAGANALQGLPQAQQDSETWRDVHAYWPVCARFLVQVNKCVAHWNTLDSQPSLEFKTRTRCLKTP